MMIFYAALLRLVPYLLQLEEDLWSAQESYMDPVTPLERQIDIAPQEDSENEEVFYFPISYDRNLFRLNTKGTRSSAETIHSSDRIGMHFDYAMEYNLPENEFITSRAPSDQIVTKTISNAKQRTVVAMSPIMSVAPKLSPLETFFIDTVNSIVHNTGGFIITPTRMPSGQGYFLRKATLAKELAIFSPISQERGMCLNPNGLKNISPEEFPNGEFYLREAVAYAIDQASNGVFHIPMALTARLTGVGEGVMMEKIHQSSGLGDVQALLVDEMNQFRLLFDIFFYNGNCQPGVYGFNFFSIVNSHKEAHFDAVSDDILSQIKGSGYVPLNSMFFPHNSYILPNIDTPSKELISSFAKHYKQGDRALKQWSPYVEDFVSSIDKPRTMYVNILTKFGFPEQTCDHVAVAIQVVQKCVPKLSPWEVLDFMFFQAHPFIFTAFSISNRAQVTGFMGDETWNNLSIVIDMALDTYYERNFMKRKTGSYSTGLHMQHLDSMNYCDLQREQDA